MTTLNNVRLESDISSSELYVSSHEKEENGNNLRREPEYDNIFNADVYATYIYISSSQIKETKPSTKPILNRIFQMWPH